MTLSEWCRYLQLVAHPATILHLADDLADTKARLDRARRTLHVAATANHRLAQQAGAVEPPLGDLIAQEAAEWLKETT